MEPLKKANNFKGPQGPVVLAILDGVGYRLVCSFNAKKWQLKK